MSKFVAAVAALGMTIGFTMVAPDINPLAVGLLASFLAFGARAVIVDFRTHLRRRPKGRPVKAWLLEPEDPDGGPRFQ